MENLSLVLTIVTSVTSLVAAVASAIGVYQKRRLDKLSLVIEETKEKEIECKKELYKVYRNLKEFLDIEKNLSEQLQIGKVTARKGHLTDRYVQPKHVALRLSELEHELKIGK